MLARSLDCSHVKVDYFCGIGIVEVAGSNPAPLIFYKYASIAADHVDHG